jgi:hypothetical protein
MLALSVGDNFIKLTEILLKLDLTSGVSIIDLFVDSRHGRRELRLKSYYYSPNSSTTTPIITMQ